MMSNDYDSTPESTATVDSRTLEHSAYEGMHDDAVIIRSGIWSLQQSNSTAYIRSDGRDQPYASWRLCMDTYPSMYALLGTISYYNNTTHGNMMLVTRADLAGKDQGPFPRNGL